MNMYYVRAYTCLGIYEPDVAMDATLLEADGVTVSLLGYREYVRIIDDYLVGPKRKYEDLPDDVRKRLDSRRNTTILAGENHAVLCVRVSVPWDGIDKDAIFDSEGVVWNRLPHKPKALAAFRSVSAALSLTRREGVSRDYDKIFDGYYVFDENTGGHRYFNHNNASSSWTCSAISGEELTMSARLSEVLYSDDAIKTVFSLFGESQTPYENGRLHSFIAAWAGLEVFIVKKFNELLARIRPQAKVSGIHQKLFDRMFSVMDGKYRVLDKFIILASYYDEAGADADIALFTKLKDSRDQFFHTMKIGVVDLPLDEVRYLLEKYLKLYLDENGKR